MERFPACHALDRIVAAQPASRKCASAPLGMEPPAARPEAAAAPAAEEGVPVIGQDPETAPLVEPQPEPAAERDGVRVDVTEQEQEREDGAQPTDDGQGETISVTLKEFVTGN